jgi:diguanylate cyclase (GGDEF)-like protein/PAS domain S-box-containing protein
MRRRAPARSWISDLTRSWSTRTGDARVVIALAVILTAGVAVLRVIAPNGADAPGVLLIVPVAICAMRFGLKGGVAAASLGMALAVVTNLTLHTNQFTWLGYGTRAAALFLVGVLVGSFVDRGRELEDELAPHRNLSLDLIATADFEGRLMSVNGAWGTTLGYARDELLGSRLLDLVHPDDRAATIAEQQKLALRGEDTLNFLNRCRHRDGSYRWLEWMIRPDVRTASFYAIARDVTTRKEAEDTLRQLLEQLAIIQRAIAERSRLDEILDTIVNAAAKVLASEIVGLRLIDENDPSYLVLAASTGVDERSARVLRRGPVTEGLGGQAIVEERLLISNSYGLREGDIPMLAANGLHAAMAAPVYGHGEIVGSLVVATHSEHQFTQAEADTLGFFAEYAGVALSTARAADAVRQALTDPLTGLPNRALFIDRLDHALARAERADGEVSVLFLDVDEFKLVNDSLGHLAGDRLLVEAARRIRKCLRPSETAARFGGDEFAILVAHEKDPPVPEILGARIIEALSAPLDVDGHELRIRASIGIATGRTDPESLLRDADAAMYRAKATKRGGVCVFEPGMQADSVRELELRHELLRAVACKEITAVFQPIVALSDGSITALEVLARWNHPMRGPIPPDVFIPLAQSAGVIQEIGSAILRDACTQLAGWRARHPGCGQLQVAVNVAPEQLGHALLRDIEEVLDEHGLPATALILELTETSLLHDSEAALSLLAQLRSRGIQIAIDDFGTGYSSLRYLRRFPVDILKIAKPFIDGIEQEDGQEWAFARLITDLATTLGLITVAEGIEVAGQHDRLVELGCAYGQGHLYARPVVAGEIDALLAADTARRLLQRAAA